jgi:hypothetical protein
VTRADKQARRQAQHALYLMAHGYRCPGCGDDLNNDQDLVDDANPRDPRSCIDCCHREAAEDDYLPQLLDAHPQLWDDPNLNRLAEPT